VIGYKDKLPKEITIVHFRTTVSTWCIGMVLPLSMILMIGLHLSVDE